MSRVLSPCQHPLGVLVAGADRHPPSCRLLSRESPSGALKAVLRKVPSKEKEKQFLEVRGGLGTFWDSQPGPHCSSWPPRHLCPQVWDQNRKVKSIDLTVLDKHGSVYDDGEGPGDAGGDVGSWGDRGPVPDPLLQTNLAAWPGHTRRPTCSTWRRRSVPRPSRSSRAKPQS